MFGQAGFLIAVGFCSEDETFLAVVLFIVAQGISGLQYGGYVCNHVDIAPRFAGTLYGVSNTVGAISGIIGPYVASLLTQDVSDHTGPSKLKGKFSRLLATALDHLEQAHCIG